MDRTTQLIADLARELGIDTVPSATDGTYQLIVGADRPIYLFASEDETLTLVTPITALPARPEYGAMLFLLRQNLFDAPMPRLSIAADEAGVIVGWLRIPVDGVGGDDLAGLIDLVADRADAILREIGDTADTEAAPPSRESVPEWSSLIRV